MTHDLYTLTRRRMRSLREQARARYRAAVDLWHSGDLDGYMALLRDAEELSDEATRLDGVLLRMQDQRIKVAEAAGRILAMARGGVE